MNFLNLNFENSNRLSLKQLEVGEVMELRQFQN